MNLIKNIMEKYRKLFLDSCSWCTKKSKISGVPKKLQFLRILHSLIWRNALFLDFDFFLRNVALKINPNREFNKDLEVPETCRFLPPQSYFMLLHQIPMLSVFSARKKAEGSVCFFAFILSYKVHIFSKLNTFYPLLDIVHLQLHIIP